MKQAANETLFGSLFNPRDGEIEAMFLRNVGWISLNYIPEEMFLHNYRCEDDTRTE
jgi:hypothetical protein